MFVNYILLLVIVLLYLLYQTITTFFNKGTLFERVNAILMTWIITLLIVHFFFCVYIYFKVYNFRGADGPSGINGLNGKAGKDGKCNHDCGQKVCMANILKEVNTHLQTNNQGPLKNKLLLNKINKICHSDNYQTILYTDKKNRPNEKKLINYIKNIIITWINEIGKNKKGSSFLTNENSTETFFKKNTSPFIEIKKYDVWEWGEKYKMKPIVRVQCAKKNKMPTSNKSTIYTLETNKYLPSIFTTIVPKDIYGPDDCPHNQLGIDKTNEKNIKKCFYYDNKKQITTTKKVYKNIEYKKFKQPFSFYNTEPLITENNQNYFPVGSVWRCKPNELDKLDTSLLKKTILISGEVKSPIDYKLIWKTCENCLDINNKVSIWRPIPPKKYVALGDIVVLGHNKPSLDLIKCVPKKYTKEFKYDTSVWTEKGFEKIENNRKTKLDKVSIWPIGYNNIEEEKQYLRGTHNLEITGGYSLFRTSNSYEKPNVKAYVLKTQYSTNITTEPEIIENSKYGFGWMGGKPREAKYSVYQFLGIVTNAIIINTNKTNSPDGFGKSYYIENVDKDLYAIKAYDTITNSFNSYLTSNNDKLIKLKTISKENKNQLWTIDLLRDDNNKIKKEDNLPLVKMINKASNKCFIQSYDTMGIITENEIDYENGSIFKLQSFNGDVFI